jgi:hydrogenase-4 component E
MEGMVAGTNLVINLMVAHLIASIAAVELRGLRRATVALAVQSLLLTAIFAVFAYLTRAPVLYWWAGGTLLTKVIIIPAGLWYFAARLPQREVRPMLGFWASIALVSIIVVVFYQFFHAYVGFVAPSPSAMVEPARSSLALAFTVFVLGLYVLMVRRDGVKIVIGLVLMENGVHLSLLSLAPTLPETTVMGISTNIVVVAFALLYLTGGIYRALGTTDTLELSQLKR